MQETQREIRADRPASRGYQNDPPAWITPRLLVGAGCQLTREFARDFKITHVINCASPSDCPSWFPQEHPLRYTELNAVDDVKANILDWYPFFLARLSAYLRDPGVGVVFIHCQCGINRSAFLALAYAVDCFGHPWNETVRSMKSQRPCCLTNPAYWRQVKAFANSRAKKHGGIPQ